MSYKQLEIQVEGIAGMLPALKAMRLPKKTKSDSYESKLGASDSRLASALIKAGSDHAKFQRGIIVWVKQTYQVGWMIEFVTYRHGVEWLSTSSSMHGELKKLKGDELASQKQADLPDKEYTTRYHISYQALRSIYRARRNHRHPDWRVYCRWIESLPYFKELIYPEFNIKNAVKLIDS